MAQHVTKRSPTAFKHFRVTDLRGTVSTAKQSSAELMAASPYPCLPSIQIQAGRPPPPPVQSPPLFCLRNSLPWHKRSHSGGDCSYGGRKKRVFLVGGGRRGWGGGCPAWGGFLRSIIKPIFVWENWSSAMSSAVSSSQTSQCS